MEIDGILASPGYSLLKLALDAASLRHKAIASNIANIDTEGYQPLRVSFEEQLQQELSASNRAQGVPAVTPRIEPDLGATSVSLDRELVNLNKNFVSYQALIKAINGKIELTNLALTEGRR